MLTGKEPYLDYDALSEESVSEESKSNGPILDLLLKKREKKCEDFCSGRIGYSLCKFQCMLTGKEPYLDYDALSEDSVSEESKSNGPILDLLLKKREKKCEDFCSGRIGFHFASSNTCLLGRNLTS